MTIRFVPIKTPTADDLRHGPDDYALSPQRVAASTGSGTPCRHCLQQVPEGRPYLIVAHRPFQGLNAYTETGPIFLCADRCRPGGGSDLPTDMLTAPTYIARGYTADERILYGTGGVIPTPDIPDRCRQLLDDPDIAFVHIRSASNNCFQCRVERA